jgi:hypothetical protein
MWMAEEAGFTVCDLIIKIRSGPMVSTKWKEAHHARKRHCFWIVCRNGADCERTGSTEVAGENCKLSGQIRRHVHSCEALPMAGSAGLISLGTTASKWV